MVSPWQSVMAFNHRLPKCPVESLQVISVPEKNLCALYILALRKPQCRSRERREIKLSDVSL